MYPRGSGGSDNVPKKSYKNAVHDGQKGERPAKCIPYKDNVQLGTDYDSNGAPDMSTTNKTHFQEPRRSTPVKVVRPKGQLRMSDSGKGKFNSVSQNRSDYKYSESEAKSAKPNRCPEHPSLINLSMDVPVDFQTVKMMSYNNNINLSNTNNNRNYIVKKLDRYTPPKEKFDATTTNQDVFQNFGVQPRVSGMRPITQRKSSAKFAKDSSSYATTFKNPGHPQRVLYNAQYEDNLRLPPKSEKFTNTSVMRSSYQTDGKGRQVERVKPFKPEHKAHTTSTDPFQGITQYNEIFKNNNNINSCVFPKYLAQEEASKRFATVLKSQ